MVGRADRGPCVQPRIFSMTESFAELFEQSQAALTNLKPGSIVTGVVVEIRSDVVVVNAGLKSEGIVPIEQFRNEAGELEVAVGDTVKVALDALENGFGETVLSRERAKRAKTGRAHVCTPANTAHRVCPL